MGEPETLIKCDLNLIELLKVYDRMQDVMRRRYDVHDMRVLLYGGQAGRAMLTAWRDGECVAMAFAYPTKNPSVHPSGIPEINRDGTFLYVEWAWSADRDFRLLRRIVTGKH